jgi:predicted transglutaminase-like cysteine proteinase
MPPALPHTASATRRRLLAWLGAAGLITVLSPGRRSVAAAPEDPGAPPAVMPDLFGWSEHEVGDPRRYVPKSQVLDRAFLAEPNPLLAVAASAGQARWLRLMFELSTRSADARIAGVDRFVNGFAWVEDDRLYGRADHWATPAEFLAAEAGDCEDFAIAKYVALARLGFSEERLRIALVHDRRRNLEHALTMVYWGGDALVLDSLAERPASHAGITRYRPICSFNRRKLWVHRPA